MTDSFGLRKAGGWSALICAVTYMVGFVILINILAPYGYGTANIDAKAVVKYIFVEPHMLIFFNTTIYIINAIALTILVLSISDLIRSQSPILSSISKAFGLIWATLVFGAGMIGNIAVETAYEQFSIDPIAAANTWTLMHKIELSLGGGNEIVGGLWFLCIGLGLFGRRSMTRVISLVAVTIGLCGLSTILPFWGDITGAMFGLGAIVCFILMSLALLRSNVLNHCTHMEH